MIAFLIALFSSIVGAICGIGGGVIIKPVLDFLQVASVSSINFLSSCTVLSMSLYSVGKSLINKEKNIPVRTVLFLSIGAAIGGILGKYIFEVLSLSVANSQTVGAVQSLCLAIITFATFLYTINKQRIRTLNTSNLALSSLIGLLLGVLSSFLGIGGGPINLVVLSFFFSMDTKAAASSSLYIILLSQIASLMLTLSTKTVPDIEFGTLILMILGGIGGGIIGRSINARISVKTVDTLFLLLIMLIAFISIFNFYRYIILPG